ncbi:c-type cytochrome [Plastorhodobacter daqingensis]|uniref:C-type cytochrome n=1 Tax=Plastorhodobacter daqingensis TaxID=1387281 RepID=A0ABW2UL43_9RHOB
MIIRSIPFLLALSIAPAALAEGDPAKGERAFRKCQACHQVEEGGSNRAGPNLHGVLGRQAGAHEGFGFSPAMIEAGAAGLVWDAEALDAFITNPRASVPGTKMTFAGIRNEGERADLIAYLASVSPAP